MGVKKWFGRLKIPHTYVILTGILITMFFLTHIIPAGQYQRAEDPASGKMVIVPDSFELIDIEPPGFFDIFLSLQKGCVESANIIFLVFFSYGFMHILVKNETMDAALGTLVRYTGKKVHLLIPVSMIAFGILSSTMGLFEEVYGLFPVFVGIAAALGYDAVVGGAIVYIGMTVGYGAATFSPYTIGIAQDMAGVAMFSGMGFRVFILAVFGAVSILYVMRYAKKIKEDPKKSVMYGAENAFSQRKTLEELMDSRMSIRQLLCLVIFFVTLGCLFYGTTRLNWYMDEIAAMYLLMMILAGAVSGYSATELCTTFIESARVIIESALVIGFTGGILRMMQDGRITDSITYYLVSFLTGAGKYASAYGMLFLQNIIKFFITSSISQAALTMPVMAPAAEMIGLSRQIAVLAFQFGNGFSMLVWPTTCAISCGLMGVPLNRWYKFIMPLFVSLAVMQIVFMTAAVMMGYC